MNYAWQEAKKFAKEKIEGYSEKIDQDMMDDIKADIKQKLEDKGLAWFDDSQLSKIVHEVANEDSWSYQDEIDVDELGQPDDYEDFLGDYVKKEIKK